MKEDDEETRSSREPEAYITISGAVCFIHRYSIRDSLALFSVRGRSRVKAQLPPNSRLMSI